MKYIIAVPEDNKFYKRAYDTHEKAVKASERFSAKGKRCAILPDEPKHILQYARYAYSLYQHNPDYVTRPMWYINFIKGPNWDHHYVEYSHERSYVRMYGMELVNELETIRSLDSESAFKRMSQLVRAVGFDPER